MADLGKAYVQIMPSAKGISGSIQKAIQPEAAKAGKGAGKTIATNISDSMGRLGSTLTKAITVPAAGAATAVGGIVSALGFKRLTGIDQANAKLKGMGYSAEDVERITGQALSAIETGMMELSEATDVAAGALAAGVSEGAELERYISLVDAAAVGANREVSEMAPIFNRVQGSGKLMTQELNMIEQGMPGFSSAMAEHLGVSQEKFREMVTDGKVSSEDFLDVMEGFAGGMAEAYADTWSGMLSYTQSYIGKIGSEILGGVFEQAKDSIKQFNDFLTSEEVVDWATRTGEKIGETFTKIVDSVKGAIDWWQNLSDGTKGAIKTMAGIAVAAGPALSALSGIIKAIIGAHEWFGRAKVAGEIFAAWTGASLSSALLIAVGAIAGLVAAGVLLYKNWDTIKEKAAQLIEFTRPVWEEIGSVINTVVDEVSRVVTLVWGALTNFWEENNELILRVTDKIWGGVLDVIETIMSIAVPIITTGWEVIKSVTSTVWDYISGLLFTSLHFILDIIKSVMQMIDGDWSGAWQTIKQAFLDVWESLSILADEFSGRMREVFFELMSKINEKILEIWDLIKEYLSEKWNSIKESAIDIWDGLKEYLIETVMNVVESIKEFFSELPERIRGIWNDIVEATTEWALEMWEKAIETGTNFLESLMEFFDDLPHKIGVAIGSVLGAVIQWSIDMWETAKETAKNFWVALKEYFNELPGRIESYLTTTWEKTKLWAIDMWETAKETALIFWNSLKEYFSQLPGRIGEYLTNTWNKVATWASDMWSKAKEAGLNFINGVIDYVKQLPGKVWTWVSNVISKLVSWVSNMGNKGREAGRDLTSKTMTAVKSLPRKMVNAGKDVVRGFWEGIKGLGSWVKNNVSSFFGGIVEGAKSKLKIKSPSRVFMGLGEYTGEGFGDGLTSMTGNVQNAMDDMLSVPDKLTSSTLGEFSAEGNLKLSEPTSSPGDANPDYFEREGIDISGNTFVVRKESDIEEIARELQKLINRKRR